MSGLDLELAFGQALNLDSSQIYRALMLALVLGMVVALVYRYAIKSRLVAPQFQLSLILLAMIGAMVMMVIGNNIARAFSLVGALAIIRFRTRLRSPLDITFVFLSLALGIACGVLAFRVAVIGTLTICLSIVALSVIPMAGMRNTIRVLRVDLAAYEGGQSAIEQVLDAFVKRQWLEEARSLRFGETLSLRYRVVLKADDSWPEALQQLSDLEGVERVVLYEDLEDGGGTE